MKHSTVTRDIRKITTYSKNLEKLFEWSNVGTPEVSVVLICYNHEKYLRRCLDSVLNQLVDFNVEIIIHDDCSKDNSKLIINEYEEKYPHIIKHIFEERNLYREKRYLIWQKSFSICKGKYIAICETDDYWNDNKKLLIQKKLMDKNPNVSFASHKVNKINISNHSLTNIPLKRLKSSILSDINVFKETSRFYSFHTSSFFFKANRVEAFLKYSEYLSYIVSFDDLSILLLQVAYGSMLYINKSMSKYLYNVPDGWTSETKKSYKTQTINYLKSLIFYYSFINRVTDLKYDKYLRQTILRNCCKLCVENGYQDKIFRNKILRKTLKKMSYFDYLKLWIRFKLPFIYNCFKRKNEK